MKYLLMLILGIEIGVTCGLGFEYYTTEEIEPFSVKKLGNVLMGSSPEVIPFDRFPYTGEDYITTDNSGLFIAEWKPIPCITLCHQNREFLFADDEGKEILKFDSDGNVYHLGKLIGNDKEIIEGLREFLKL